MSIDIANESEIPADEKDLADQAAFMLRKLHINPAAELSIMLVGEVAMAALHERFMDEPGSTDVLSFPMDELRPNDPEPGILGDIVISPLFARAQAEKAGHSFEHEVYILAAHGLLHLLGYDHQELDEEKAMFALQEDLVKRAAL